MLQVKPDKPLAASLLALIRTLDIVAKQLGIAYFVIGATARDILMEHVYDLETTRATRDIDFAVAVSSWEEFDQLKARLIATGEFVASENLHRLCFRERADAYPLDLVPFAGVERDGEIAWPPKGEFVMNVTGYSDALASALNVEIEPGFSVKIVSLPAMIVLKILAWNDRPERDKHASDTLLILRNYHDAGQFVRIYDDAADLLETYDHDLEATGAALLGRDARRDVVRDTLTQVLNVFANQRNQEKFASQMIRSQAVEIERAMFLLNAFLQEVCK